MNIVFDAKPFVNISFAYIYVALCILLLCGLGLFADYSHFTWWAVTVAVVYYCMFVINQSHRFIVFTLEIMYFVILAVHALSFDHCQMLNETLHDIGEIKFFCGDFTLHYMFAILPTLIFIFKDIKRITYYDARQQTLFAGCLLGLYVYGGYMKTYKCNMLSNRLFAVCVAIYIFAAECILLKIYYKQKQY